MEKQSWLENEIGIRSLDLRFSIRKQISAKMRWAKKIQHRIRIEATVYGIRPWQIPQLRKSIRVSATVAGAEAYTFIHQQMLFSVTLSITVACHRP
jgi:hypothetical protein